MQLPTLDGKLLKLIVLLQYTEMREGLSSLFWKFLVASYTLGVDVAAEDMSESYSVNDECLLEMRCGVVDRVRVDY
jgi:hypothetical protein